MKLPVLAGQVATIEVLSPSLRRFTLIPRGDEKFPAAAGGAHVVMTLRGATRNWRNAYSLVSAPGRRDSYTIIVRLVAPSRGGSAFLHAQVSIGDPVDIDPPVNLFPIPLIARRHLLLAGGIGVTPFLSYLPALRARGTAFELRQFCRSEDAAAFTAMLSGPECCVHPGRDRVDIAALLAAQPLGTHVSVCGPPAFMEGVVAAARKAGYPVGKIHLERFGGSVGGAPFRAVLRRSKRDIEVKPDESLLEALEAAGIEAPCLCRGGACGECRVAVLDGTPEHRDHVMDAAEHARGDAIMTCVSRARSPVLVLDL